MANASITPNCVDKNDDCEFCSEDSLNINTADLFEEIKNSVESYFGKKCKEIRPCGNHELNRNLVYILKFDNEQYVIKLFFKQERYVREMQVIPISESMNPLRIIGNGKTNNGLNWIVYNFLDGWLLEHIYDDMDLDQLRAIFYQIGEKLAAFHALKSYDFFGDWQEEKRSSIEDYQKFMQRDCERLISNLVYDGSENDEVLKTAVTRMRNEYVNIRQLHKGRLCHRDMDGRNILIHVNRREGLKVVAFLDFEKAVVFNPYMDIISLYKKYFIYEPKLIEPFFRGYESQLPVDASFDEELRFNLYRIGIDICSWSKRFSEKYYFETIKYLKKLESVDHLIPTVYSKGKSQE